jgi:magnesium transporter
METTTLVEELEAALAADDNAGIRAVVDSIHRADVAEAVETLDLAAIWRVLSTLSPRDRAETYGYLNPQCQVELARSLDRRQLAHILRHMSSDERVDLFNQLAPDQQEELLPSLAQVERDDIRQLARYEEGTAGAIMTSDYATLAPEFSASKAIERLRLEAPDKETIYQAYVIDSHRRLLGTVSLRDLIVARSSDRVGELMNANMIATRVDESAEDTAAMLSRYDLIALPVLDQDERLVGIVTYDDAMDVAEEEATEDIQRVGSVTALESSVRQAPITLLYRKRIAWLVILVFANALSGMGIAQYESTLSTHLALVFFLPLLIASSGNAGAQAATLTVRALATGDVRASDWTRMLARELLVALLLGATMALVVSLLGIYRGGVEIAVVVAATMVAVVVVGSLIGMSLPFVLEKLGLDPATASAPLVTSLADICGVLIYFTIASWYLSAPVSGA